MNQTQKLKKKTQTSIYNFHKATGNKFCVLYQEIIQRYEGARKQNKVINRNLGGKYEKQLLKVLFVFCQVMKKGTSELTQNAEFILSGLIAFCE